VTGSAGPFDRLLHLGNVMIDLVLGVSALPERGADVLADTSRSAPGGGFNVMAAAARHGLHVAYGGARGSGPFAALAQAALAEEGIDVLLPPKSGLDTGVVVSIVDADGERTFVTAPGAEATLTADDLAAVQAGPRDAVYLSGYSLAHASNRPALLGWLGHLADPNLVIFDPGPLADRIPPADLATVLRRADWLTCNTREAAILTAQPDPLTAIRRLADGRGRAGGRSRPDSIARDDNARDAEGVAHYGAAPDGVVPDSHARHGGGVIVRTGPDGCLLACRGAEPVHIPGFPVAATDTSGAGDTHTGTFIAALAAGADPAQAARTANAAAALSVTQPGPATAPTAADLARFLSARGLSG
jgi:sugar/nucleoside kinase (ribokinase family)